MSYAIVQTTLIPPSVEQLQRAFRAVKFLTAVDAHILAKDAFGILVKDLTPENAAALQGALRAERVETEIVEECLLPELPPTKFLTRLDCAPEALVLYDPLGRSFRVEWGHLWMIAAGNVLLSEFVEQRKVRRDFSRDGGDSAQPVIETVTREEQNYHLMLEIILSRRVARYSVKVERFNFAYLGERRTKSVASNFASLVRDLIEFAPHAALNQGAFCLRDNEGELFTYPSKSAFLEEITWLLWRLSQAPK